MYIYIYTYTKHILGNTFEHFLEKGSIQSHITILGATSGDTGSAALHGLMGKKNVNCFIMYPKGKVMICIYMYIYIYTCICMYVYIYVCMCICIYTYTYMNKYF
jgi:hypothetical protein